MGCITQVPGIAVGHATDLEAATGCTVVLCPPGTVGGVDVRGSAPGTRETDALHPLNLVDEVHAVLLTGGSAFGLAAAGGAMRFLEEQGIGFATPAARVPIVPAAVVFDLPWAGRCPARRGHGLPGLSRRLSGSLPRRQRGRGHGRHRRQGARLRRALKGGLGTASIRLTGDLVVAALAVVNAFGAIYDHQTGRAVAGHWEPGSAQASFGGTNTTLGAVATNARLDKPQTTKLAQLAQNGIAMTVRPAHSMLDGDTVFGLATGAVPVRGLAPTSDRRPPRRWRWPLSTRSARRRPARRPIRLPAQQE